MTAQLPTHFRRVLATGLTLGALLTATACAGDDLAEDDNASGGGEASGTVRIASQSFDEAALVTAMYEAVLTDEGYDVEKTLVDTRDVYMAKFPADFDVVPEYVAGLGDFLNIEANGPEAETVTTNDATESIEAIKPLTDEAGITLLDPSPAASQNAFFVTEDYASENGVSALSDLEGESVVLAAAPDCEGRPDCEGGLTSVYGIEISELLPLGYASPETYQSVIDGESDLGLTGTLDGTLDDQGLVLLEDDRGIQPAQNLIPAVSTEFLDEHPEVAEPLNGLMAALDNETLGELIARVTVDREKPEDVASDFLTEEGLIG
ncbi:osmoprotectant transport system substrate-binding protein [Nocardioides thalensis]|uniref:Osmoprotectant transport system substrate-binding protein n=1 Tax=Nocardioides thalensis TaxID=1914755 RepID=A0A853BXB3_9ACTN|nr:ABC transporter substrate-binding protein [Nocardioides thalensis]NYI99476.1 osmoprotectant transport system substrate-binding protein [Nocardioides thalensis]